MVSSSSSPMEEKAEALVYDIKLSSVGPGNVTGQNSMFEPGNMDLAMKLHYIRGVYYFKSEAFEGLTTLAIKEPIFLWLNEFPMTSGRFRRDESGRPYIKCNDCGLRFIEAKCRTTLDEWLEMSDIATLEKLLCSNQIIGPELSFSPLIYIQLTKFKCGGMAVGLSWAHVLGDAFSAAEYMNKWSRVAAGFGPKRPIIKMADSTTKPTYSNGRAKLVDDPLSVKRVDPVGDNWANVTKRKMEAFSFDVTATQLSDLRSKLSRNATDFPAFEAISAVIWRCIANIRGGESEPKSVTICKRSEENEKQSRVLSNNQAVTVVKADFSVTAADPSDLAALMKNECFDEQASIEEAVERGHGLPDFIVYGANLTFVNLEGADFYDFEYRGQKPVRVSCRIDGVGENGAVLVLPAAEGGGGGRLVMAILPENEVVAVKSELKREGLMG